MFDVKLERFVVIFDVLQLTRNHNLWIAQFISFTRIIVGICVYSLLFTCCSHMGFNDASNKTDHTFYICNQLGQTYHITRINNSLCAGYTPKLSNDYRIYSDTGLLFCIWYSECVRTKMCSIIIITVWFVDVPYNYNNIKPPPAGMIFRVGPIHVIYIRLVIRRYVDYA